MRIELDDVKKVQILFKRGTSKTAIVDTIVAFDSDTSVVFISCYLWLVALFEEK